MRMPVLAIGAPLVAEGMLSAMMDEKNRYMRKRMAQRSIDDDDSEIIN